MRSAALLLGLAAATAHADDTCAGFKWDVSHERALFAGNAQALLTSADADSAPELAAERLYDISLRPQETLTLRVPAGPKAKFDGAFAGFAYLKIPLAGRYRVSLDQPGWIDLVSEHGLINARDFSGQHGCKAPHKVVEFDLPAGTVLLQLTGISGRHVEVALTQPATAP